MLANIDDVADLVRGVRAMLATDGVFVFETQYGRDVIEKNLLDTVYHEHLSYFNVGPLDRFFSDLDMNVFDVQRIWTKGGSLRVSVQLTAGSRPRVAVVNALIDEEERGGFKDLERYNAYTREIGAIRDELVALVDEQRARGRKVAGYGVSVGTTALLPQLGMTERIDFLVDDNPNRAPVMIGPGYRLPVRDAAALYDNNVSLVVIFAWRYADPIILKHARFQATQGRFVIPLPAIDVR